MAFSEVRYYTVHLENHSSSEFADFQTRMKQYNKRELDEINRYLFLIGEQYGADPRHFKTEDAAERLPPPYHRFVESERSNDFGLRLYCIRLSRSMVILLNGDRKTALKVQDCKSCYPHFDLARKLSKAIDNAIIDNNIELDYDEREILYEDDFEITI